MNRAVDHLVLAVNDLEAAREAYRRMGFTLTPPAQHPWGTANSLVQLQGNFLELLAVAEPEKIPPAEPNRFSFGAFNQSYLKRRQGLSMLVFQSSDARRDQAEFAARGLATYEPFDFSRQAKLPDGSLKTVSFSLAFVTEPRMPDAAFFTCQQHAPEFFWKPDYQRHANGARAVVEVVMLANDPAGLAEFFGKLIEPAAVSRSEGALKVALGQGALSVLDATRLAQRFPGIRLRDILRKPHFAGYSIAVDDLDAAEDVLKRNEIPAARAGDRLQIAADHSFGAVIELTTHRP
ncbi:MAG TPA: VOC family protein [Stellaceae bacterium]|jgi:catechol 2,3-dioxygenase-like lactoylglutathione lyase family enzyme|nr:VOC family protein [Stellaceae bacterium]